MHFLRTNVSEKTAQAGFLLQPYRLSGQLPLTMRACVAENNRHTIGPARFETLSRTVIPCREKYKD